MAFKVSAAQQKELADRRKLALESWVEYTQALHAVRDALDEYEGLRTAVTDYVAQVAEDLRAEWDDKSDKWKESDAGQAADEFVSSWESVSVDDPECPDIPDSDPLDDALDELPMEQG